MSSQTGRTYIVPQGGSCESSNLVYLITCSVCTKQYVGQTLRPLRERLREHFRYITQKTDQQPLGRHFAQPNHNGLQIQVQILEYIQTPPRLERTKQLREDREKHWIHQLRSIEPFGLNIMGKWAHLLCLILNFYYRVHFPLICTPFYWQIFVQ